MKTRTLLILYAGLCMTVVCSIFFQQVLLRNVAIKVKRNRKDISFIEIETEVFNLVEAKRAFFLIFPGVSGVRKEKNRLGLQ